ncbi:family 78 glycoside hydrolase catalytic domain [Flavobacterium sp. UMI-01]|uniref:family 78 glycoside hydrolase catalytic domain n=1 Tax=Flavobacterium sp. UMI-01 TaxID=1441053 RepID=UPI001C7DD488|nr:trehalase family glycosidase [Flavobacterium sp. UMI-01]GIZ09749.1 hypothetical protein FUMI01_24760 [Flavobacterium sp. UMI-01]
MKKCLFLLLWVTVSLAQNGVTNFELKTSLFPPQKVIQINKDHYLIDFGKAFFGTVEMIATKEQHDSIICHLGEKLENSNQIDRKPNGTIRYQKVVLPHLFANTPIALQFPADKRNTGPAAIALPKEIGVIMPFRYLEIENLKIPIQDLQIVQKAIHYSFNDQASSFSSSVTVLDAIWDMCKHTIKATSFSGYYIDGDRERIPYEADAYINQLSHYCVDNDYTMARRTNAYFINNPTWPTEWLLHTVLLFYMDYLYTGDVAPLKKYYENLKVKTLMNLERPDGLISSQSPALTEDLILKLGFKKTTTKIKDIIDWPGAQKDTGWKIARPEGERDGYEIVAVNTVVNSFYYYNLKLMAEIATAIGNKKEANLFKNKAAKVKTTLNSKLFDAEKGYYVDGENSTHASLHGNMLPLAFDLVPKEHIKTVTEFVKSRGMACSVYGAQYLLEGLYKNNEAKYAFDLITETNGDRNWWNMIKVGATMTMEAWDMKYKPNSDWNHAWGTAPLNIVTRYMWGIQPKTPGFAVASIHPQLEPLTKSTIEVPTIKGGIKATYVQVNDKLKKYSIELPPAMAAEFKVEPDDVVLLNGKKNSTQSGVVVLKSGINTLEITSAH